MKLKTIVQASRFGFALPMLAGMFALTQVQPAQAASMIASGSRIDFVGQAEVQTTGIDFKEFLVSPMFPGPDEDWIFVTSATSDFAAVSPVAGLAAAIGDITDITAIPLASGIDGWLKFQNGLSFNLRSIMPDVAPRRYFVAGTVSAPGFESGDFIGELTAQVSANGVQSFSGTIQAVPTPALLPALSLLSVQVLRKRQKHKSA